MMKSSPSDIPTPGSRWRNNRSGKIYKVLGYARDCDYSEAPQARDIVYRSDDMLEGEFWLRSLDSWQGLNRHGEPRFTRLETTEFPEAADFVLQKNAQLYSRLSGQERSSPPGDLSDFSDGYHTFGELYDHRHALFLALARHIGGWKSRQHSDGEVWNGWFIAGTTLRGLPVTYHLPIDLWEAAGFLEERDKAPEWDGHTPQDVVNRLMEYVVSGPEVGPRAVGFCVDFWQEIEQIRILQKQLLPKGAVYSRTGGPGMGVTHLTWSLPEGELLQGLDGCYQSLVFRRDSTPLPLHAARSVRLKMEQMLRDRKTASQVEGDRDATT